MTALLGGAPSALDRFSSPLFTVTEATRYLDVPASTVASFAKGYRPAGKGRPEVTGSPVLATVRSPRRGPVIPFVGLAEGLVLTAMRCAGVPLQRIRPALARLDEELGLQHALAAHRRRRRCCPGGARARGGAKRQACLQRGGGGGG